MRHIKKVGGGGKMDKHSTEEFLEHLLYKNVFIPDNWRTDPRYDLQWKGGFTYGLPRGSKCPRVIIPSFGRVVCSDGKGLSRTMCLSECMIGYQHVEKSKVFICHKDGIWMNIYKKRIETPFVQCAPINNFK